MMKLRERKRKNCSPDEKMMKVREKKKKKSSPPPTTKGDRRKLIPMRVIGKKDPKKQILRKRTDYENPDWLADYEEVDKQIRKNLENVRKERLGEIFAGGFVFAPSEVQLLKYCLLKKYQTDSLLFCPVDEVDNPYALYPQDLLVNLAATGTSGGYFFTTCRPNENQSIGDVAQGQWTFTEMNMVLDQDQPVGVKKVYEYCERDGKGKYKVIEYQLDPAPVNWKNCTWFLCQLIYNDDVSCGYAA
ncbi:hypothetical protein FRX31_007221 [Thalictrum thalictroides]|uniref:NAC domain-containing protein n=1 Tax=Thalictrum thalictroides TaxID=46969 RepID=A0A7J6X493_THATH|nr:hypothetical protein FRX31_007221 [Thalictrum thalictroides]